jgi:MoaA/NifB/PqqE/SkfB family radical SAM enzyme
VSASDWLRRIERSTRPVDDRTRAALDRRWAELPDHVKTPAQTLGRAGIGCEGTHGVFPRCNFACKPCYHSKDANAVRIDGPHTVARVGEQMAHLAENRAPHAHAQLIGGEVSLLDPDDHAAALAAMRRHGREPMSFTHGDFDYDYLERLALGSDGRRRFKRLSFAVHIDTTMIGRRGIRRTNDEAALDPHRRAFTAMFKRLRKEHGVRFFLAHNMTVTPANVEQIPGVIQRSRSFGYNLFSFQPAAYVGDERRWNVDYRSLTSERVWEQIERGVGSALPSQLFQIGDERCNRTAFGFYLGDTWHSVLDQDDPTDLEFRDAFLAHCGGVHFNAPLRLLIPRLARLAAGHPHLIPLTLRWLRRTVRRVGGPSVLLRHRVAPMTFVMHRFMHAEDVKPAWELLERGQTSDDPTIKETQERLLACSYAMAHPETGRIVPACVQHSVLDPDENRELKQVLPLPRVRGCTEVHASSAVV